MTRAEYSTLCHARTLSDAEVSRRIQELTGSLDDDRATWKIRASIQMAIGIYESVQDERRQQTNEETTDATDLDLKIARIHCSANFTNEEANCSIKTSDGQVYTTHATFSQCFVLRGPGQ